MSARAHRAGQTKETVQIHQTPFPLFGVGSGHETSARPIPTIRNVAHILILAQSFFLYSVSGVLDFTYFRLSGLTRAGPARDPDPDPPGPARSKINCTAVLRLVRIVLDTKTDCLELLFVSILRFIAQTFEIVARFRKKLDTFQYKNMQHWPFCPQKVWQ